MSNPIERERRRHGRYSTTLPVVFRTDATGAFADATLLNTSAGGVLLATKVAVSPPTRLRLWIRWGDIEITIEARSVACDPTWDGFRLHVAFTMGQLSQVQLLHDLLLSLEHEIDAARLRRTRRLPRRSQREESADLQPLRDWDGPVA